MDSTFDFKSWITAQKSDNYTILELADGEICLDTEYASAYIDINVFNLGITEFKITDKKSHQNTFYLHFQIVEPAHAKELFQEMTEVLLKMKDCQKTRVLLCCSSGLTTNYYALKMNDAADVMANGYQFDAVSYDRVYQLGFDYDVILIAPQIAYMYQEIHQVFPDKTVLKVPAGVFGSYDVGGLFKFIEDNRDQRNEMPEEHAAPYSIRDVQTEKKILVIGTLLDSNEVQIIYRIYEKGMPKQTQTVIKKKISVKDIEDIMNTVLSYEDDIDSVCICVPGVVSNGYVDLAAADLTHFDLKTYLSERYAPQFIISNNANAIALGLYSVNPKYHSIIYHSQPAGSLYAGEGTVIDGKLIEGRKGIAGEMKFLLPVIKNEIDEKKRWTPEGNAQIIAQSLLAGICTIAPEAIFIRTELTPDMNMIKEDLAEHLPREYIPKLIHVKNINEYMMFGELMMCVEELPKQGRTKAVNRELRSFL